MSGYFKPPDEKPINFAFSDALICLQQLGHNEEAEILQKRWQDEKVDPAVTSFKPEERPFPWVADFINKRFSQQEQTDWYRLVKNGAQPYVATLEMLRRRQDDRS